MDVSISLALIAGLILLNTVFFVPTLIKAMRAFSEARKLLELARLQLVPLSHDVSQIIGEARSIVRSVDKEMDKIGDSLTAVRDTTHNLKEFELMIQERIEQPLLDITAVLSALVKGGRVFWQHFIKK